MSYKWSFYNYFMFNESDFICYNTKSGAIIFGETRLLNSKCLKDDATNLSNHEYFSTLYESGIIIDKDTDELAQLRELNTRTDLSTLHITIVPTINCNFSCPYCYQNGLHKNAYMSKETKARIIKLIKNKCKEYPIKSVDLTWFGGEPTLSIRFIEIFMDELTKLSRSTTKFKTTTAIITNGYLLKPEIFERLYNSYVRIFQITLDGVEDNHDRYRILHNGGSTFQTIYSNLIAIKNLSKEKYDFLIQIRANFMNNNLPSMKKLVNRFKRDFADDERFSISFRPIIDFTGDFKKDTVTKIEARQAEANMLKYMYSLDIETDENPMFTLLPIPISRWCKSCEGLRYVINYDGSVYRCNSAMTDAKYQLGTLGTDGELNLDEQVEQRWNSSPFKDTSSTCLKCKRLPICMGGCVKEIIDSGKKPCHWSDSYIKKELEDLLITK